MSEGIVCQSTILVVDDEKMICQLLYEMLREVGHTVISDLNGQGALDRMACIEFDLVIVNLLTPEMNGLEFLEKLKGEDGRVSIPVIVLADVPTIQECATVLRAGVKDYLPKPLERNQLLRAVERALPKHQLTSA